MIFPFFPDLSLDIVFGTIVGNFLNVFVLTAATSKTSLKSAKEISREKDWK